MILIDKTFDLAQTLDCGQAFRWVENDGYWSGVAYGKSLKLRELIGDNKIEFLCSEDDFDNVWKKYFDLDTDYVKIRERLSSFHPRLKESIGFAPGINILRQDPWEALISFIISQNNNIPRIKGIIGRLCETYGEKVGEQYSFPCAKVISKLSEDDLAPLRSGFRAKYILSAANIVSNNDIDFMNLYTMPIEQAKKELMKIKGVGPKVTDCVLLYGFYRTECFPLDVWMKKAMETFFPELSPEDFGENAGIAQQYIFHYSRMNAHLFDK